jgi:hypothetical protein
VKLRLLSLIMIAGILSLPSLAADASAPQVEIARSAVGPRALEALTTQSIVRDYRLAWQTMGSAFHYGTPNLLDAYFMGQAKTNLAGAVAGQEKADIHIEYLNQTHHLEPAFYAPEGDVLELHDNAEFDLRISEGDKIIQNQRIVTRYVVLMTPAADRWVVRQLQEVQEF